MGTPFPCETARTSCRRGGYQRLTVQNEITPMGGLSATAAGRDIAGDIMAPGVKVRLIEPRKRPRAGAAGQPAGGGQNRKRKAKGEDGDGDQADQSHGLAPCPSSSPPQPCDSQY